MMSCDVHDLLHVYLLQRWTLLFMYSMLLINCPSIAENYNNNAAKFVRRMAREQFQVSVRLRRPHSSLGQRSLNDIELSRVLNTSAQYQQNNQLFFIMELRECQVANGKNTMVKVRVLIANTFTDPNTLLIEVLHLSKLRLTLILISQFLSVYCSKVVHLYFKWPRRLTKKYVLKTTLWHTS